MGGSVMLYLGGKKGASGGYGPKASKFNGRVKWVEIDLGADAQDADHLITAEARLHVAMTRQ